MQQLVDFVVVVVVVPDAPHCLDVVPAGAAEERGVDAGVSAHRAVRQVVDRAELVVQTLRRVLVKPGHYCKLSWILYFVYFDIHITGKKSLYSLISVHTCMCPQ